MAKEVVYLRGHHLRFLYEYALFATSHKDNPKLRELRTKRKDERVVRAAVEGGHSKKHGVNATNTLKKALSPDVNIRLTDTLDDICATCNNKNKKECKEFIPYGVSAAADDRATLYFYGLIRREYTSKFVIKKIIRKRNILNILHHRNIFILLYRRFL